MLSAESLGPIAEGTDVSYTVSLSSEPTATTTVGITGHGDTSIALSGLSASSTLTFTATNWNTPQTVTVTADEDPDAVDDSVTLTHTANGGDYVNVTEKLTVTVTDDEVTGLKLSATSLNPVEGAAGTTYTVRLTSEPTGTVNVEIGGHTDTDLTLSAATPHLHGLQLERGADRDRDRGRRPGRGRRHDHADTHGQRRGLRRRHEESSGQGGGRRVASPGALEGVHLPRRGEPVRRELHRQAGKPADRDRHGRDSRTRRYRPAPLHDHPHLHDLHAGTPPGP